MNSKRFSDTTRTNNRTTRTANRTTNNTVNRRYNKRLQSTPKKIFRRILRNFCLGLKNPVMRNRMAFMCGVVAVAFVLVITGTKVTSASTSTDAKTYKKCYKSIEIKSGDTLWDIAEEYMCPSEYSSTAEYVSELKSMNKLKSDQIHEGNYLIVAFFVDEDGQQTGQQNV